MKVYLEVASTAYRENSKYYNKVLETIAAMGHNAVQADAATQIESVGDKNTLDDDDWHILCEREVRQVLQSNIIILDVTNKATFGVGYLAALALENNKPTLFLQRDDSLRGSFINGLRHPKLTRATFANIDDLTGIVEGFLKGVVG
jgi:hypothetical protein